jgi:hypothetical protein
MALHVNDTMTTHSYLHFDGFIENHSTWVLAHIIEWFDGPPILKLSKLNKSIS